MTKRIPLTHKQRRGASLLSYGLLIGLVGVIALGAITRIGENTDALFTDVSDSLTNATIAGPAGSPVLSPSASPAPTSASFASVGQHSFTVPAGVTSISVQMWGGGGFGANGGYGGYTEGTVSVTPGESWTVEIGGANQRDNGSPSDFGAGGGRAALWQGSNTNEVLVAGGGGGSTGSGSVVVNFWAGGDGGGSSGSAGQSGQDSNQSFGNAYGGQGGTGSAGGAGGGCDSITTNHLCPGETGSRITGGNGSPAAIYHGSAGGDGYYGGGQGGATGGSLAGGGGGSGFVSSSPGVSGSTYSFGQGGYNTADRGTAGDPDGNLGKVIISW